MCKEMQEIQIFLRVLFVLLLQQAAVPRARKGRGSLYRRVRAAIALARLFGPYLLSQGRWLHIYSNRHSKLSQVTLPTLGTIHTHPPPPLLPQAAPPVPATDSGRFRPLPRVEMRIETRGKVSR